METNIGDEIQEEADFLDAAYAQAENEERQQFEERILTRAQRVYEEFSQDVKTWRSEQDKPKQTLRTLL